jgi:hypothetical protein
VSPLRVPNADGDWPAVVGFVWTTTARFGTSLVALVDDLEPERRRAGHLLLGGEGARRHVELEVARRRVRVLPSPPPQPASAIASAQERERHRPVRGGSPSRRRPYQRTTQRRMAVLAVSVALVPSAN